MNKLQTDSEQLRVFLATHRRLTVITGAGISCAAGIPTYRDETGTWRHQTPITQREFKTDQRRRQRYWARSMRGWPAVKDALPTTAHQVLVRLEELGHIDSIITQNVDRLHQQAGSRRVVDLHGRLDRVKCLTCDETYQRSEIQRWLVRENGELQNSAPLRPDGDAELPTHLEEKIVVPECSACGGLLMPDVVFFGANVPRSTVIACMEAIERTDALLVIGSSLQVFSGYRFCRHASRQGKPVMLINSGITRADSLATLKLQSNCQALLPAAIGSPIPALEQGSLP